MSGEIRTQKTELHMLIAAAIEKIGNVSDLGEFGGAADDIDVTNLDSTAKEFMTGLVDNGEIALQLNLNPQDEQHQFLQAEAGSGNRFQCCIGLSDGTAAPTVTGGDLTQPLAAARTSFKFLASVKGFKFGAKVNDAIRVTVTLRISGAITPVWKTP